MPTLRFDNEDFLRSKVLVPKGYHCLVKSITTQAAKKDQSAVYVINLKVVEPGQYYGVPLAEFISEKAQGAGIPFIRACNGGKDPDPGVNYELNNGVGKILKVQVVNGLYNGKVQNQVAGYDPADAGFVAKEEE